MKDHNSNPGELAALKQLSTELSQLGLKQRTAILHSLDLTLLRGLSERSRTMKNAIRDLGIRIEPFSLDEDQTLASAPAELRQIRHLQVMPDLEAKELLAALADQRLLRLNVLDLTQASFSLRPQFFESCAALKELRWLLISERNQNEGLSLSVIRRLIDLLRQRQTQHLSPDYLNSLLTTLSAMSQIRLTVETLEQSSLKKFVDILQNDIQLSALDVRIAESGLYQGSDLNGENPPKFELSLNSTLVASTSGYYH